MWLRPQLRVAADLEAVALGKFGYVFSSPEAKVGPPLGESQTT